MKARSCATFSLSVCILFGSLALAEQGERPGTGGGTVGFSGSVKKVDPESKVIELDRGRKFSIDAGTEIKRGDITIKLGDIKMGERVSIEASGTSAKDKVIHANKVQIK